MAEKQGEMMAAVSASTGGVVISGSVGCDGAMGGSAGGGIESVQSESTKGRIYIPSNATACAPGGVDISQMQAQALANQQMLYGMYGQQYMPGIAPGAGGIVGMPHNMFPTAYMTGGGLPMTPSFYAGVPQYPSPTYYDPYGMLNPANCIVPMPSVNQNSQSKAYKKKKDKKWWCC